MYKKLLAGMLALILTFTSVSIPEDVYAAQNNEDTITEMIENGDSSFHGDVLTNTIDEQATKSSEYIEQMDETTENRNSDVAELENILSVEGTNSVGNLLASELSQEITEQEENNGCNVFSIEVIDTSAVVSFETVENATLVVGIYDEAGVKMVAAGSLEVYSGETTVVVDIETESMPEYFYLRGFLVETDTLRPLCTSYESPMYTQEMQEFLAKTTADFDSEKVLKLDDDTTNNFAVYSDETIIVPETEGSNEVVTADETSNTYVIANADQSITSLQAGDIFAYEYEEGNVLIVKVASITVDGTTATITGEDTSMEEVFQYVKIDSEAGLSEATIDPSSCGEGVTYEGLVDYTESDEVESYAIEVSGSEEKAFKTALEKSVTSDAGNFTVSGVLEMKITCSAKLYISTSQQYVELKLDYSALISVSASGKGSVEVPLITVGFHYCGVIVELTPSIVLNANASISVKGTLKGVVGFRATGDGMKNLTSAPKFQTEFKAEGSIYIGFSLEPKVKIISDNVVSANLTAKVGVEVTAVMDYNKSESGDVIHSCDSCVDGDIYAKINLDAGVKLLNLSKLTFRISMINVKEKVGDFYYSVDRDTFGFTECPYLVYRVKAIVVDSSGKPISGAVVQEQYTTDENGKTEFYLGNGEYRIKTAKTGYRTGTYHLLMAGKADEILIRLYKSGESSSGSGSSADDSGSGEIAINPIEPDELDETIDVENQRLSMGDYHSGYITEDGSLYMWGDNSDGELGNGTRTDSSIPIKIMDDVVSVSLGRYHSGAITKDGSLYMWGYNRDGQLGNGTEKDSNIPIKIMDDVVSVSLGDAHSAAITRDGSLYMWGYNYYGELGNGTTENSSIPIKIMDDVVSVSLGDFHSAAITQDGSLYMWGCNSSGELGNGTRTDSSIPIKIVDNVVSVSLGADHSAAITRDGSLYMWGYNWDGQLGNGTEENSSLIPIKIMDDVVSVSLGDAHSGAITGDGSLYMWGDNAYGQLGNGTTENSSIPIKIQVPTDSTTASVSVASFEDENAICIIVPDESSSDIKAASAISDTATEAQTASFSKLTPNDTYNFYVAKSLTAENLLSSDNLLYITQSVADDSGKVKVTYEVKENYADAVVFMVGSTKQDLSGATVQIPQVSCSGSEQIVIPTVTYQGRTLVLGRDYELTSGYSAAKVGTYTLTITGIGTYSGTATAEYQMICGHNYTENVTKEPTCTTAGVKTVVCAFCGDSHTEEIAAAGHNFSGEWSVEKAATCTAEGVRSQTCAVCGEKCTETIAKTEHTYQDEKVIKQATAKKDGTMEQKCSVCGSKTTVAIPAAKTLTLSASTYTYNGKAKKPSVTVTDGKGNALKKKTDYTVTYAKGRKDVGSYTVTVKLKGKYTGTLKKTFTIVPKSTGISKVTASKNGFTVKWKKQKKQKKQTTGYEIQYSTSSKFTKKTTKTVAITKNSTTSKKITGIKAKKKYYVRVRTYKTVKVNGKSKKLYSDWSKVKSIEIKK